MISNESGGTAAEKLLFLLHHKLDDACAGGGSVPVGASALLGRAIDEMRASAVPVEQVRRAETVAIALHRLEWGQPDERTEAAGALARVRDDVRMLLTSPADAELAQPNHSGTLFDWPLPRVAGILPNPVVWLSRRRQHRLVAA